MPRKLPMPARSDRARSRLHRGLKSLLWSSLVALFPLQLLIVPSIQAAPYGSQPWQGLPPGQWNFRNPAQRQSGTPQQTPSTPSPYAGGWPNQQPGYSNQGYYPSKTTAPYLETEFGTHNPYVQEGVLLRLSVISQNNLLTATPQIPRTDDLVYRKIEGPVTYSDQKKGQRVIVNDFYYEVTPLKSGQYNLPAIEIFGEEQGTGYRAGNRAFSVKMPEDMSLEVRDANPDSRPWIPLDQLDLTFTIPKEVRPAAGKPLPVTIELTATGKGGDHLPSLAHQLETDAFRVYLDQSFVETRLDKKSGRITGRRLETFTLVPQFGGDLKLPQLSVSWWNTRADIPQRASVPMQPIAVSGAQKSSGFFTSDSDESALFPGGSSSAFWIPLALTFGIIFGYWMAIGLSHRRKGSDQKSPLEPLIVLLQRPMLRMAPAFSPLKDKLRATTAILNPVTRWHRWRRRLVGALPLSVRFWFCVRFVDEETDPEIWGYTLRFLANKHLGLPPNVPFSVIGKNIVEFHPKAEPRKIDALIHDLEHAIYGHKSLDFERWKEAFKHEIRPSLRLWPSRRRLPLKSDESTLPNLNPGHILGS
ncbi:MAG: hypothetical protein ABW068_04690 [Candidatus Thiodiazotropha sp.]